MGAARPVAALALASALVAGCGGAPEPEAPNLLLVVVDTLRADRTSAYGHARDTTPSLRRAAAGGVRFESAYAPLPGTGPAHATLFTSLYPLAHGVVRNGVPLGAEPATLAEILRARGYRTAAVVSSFPLHRKFGLDRGFEQWEDDFDPDAATLGYRRWEGHAVPEGFDRRAGATTERALRLLRERDPGRPFLLFVHYFDPHAPYVPPEPFRRRFVAGREDGREGLARALYDAEVAYADAEIGRLLDAVDAAGLAADTLVAITADHGEGLFDHGYLYHDIHLYEEAVRVPLVLRWPARLPAGRVVHEPVELVDLLPTLLELLGAAPGDAAERFQGESLAAAARGEAALDPGAPVFLQRRPFPPSEVAGFRVAGPAFGVRAGRWKYLEAEEEGVRELFDLGADPGERENLLEVRPERAAALSAALRAWRRTAGRTRGAAPEVDPEDRRRLEAMGYAR